MLWLCFLVAALAVSPETVEQRLAEVASLRSMRLVRSAPPISATNVRIAAQGNVVSGVSNGRAWGATVADLPIGKLWAGLNDETRHPGYTAVSYSELLSGRRCEGGRAVLQYLPVPMVADRWWIGHLRNNGSLDRETGGSVRELVWQSSVDPAEITSASGRKIIEGAVPIVSSKGAWLLVAIDPYSTWIEYYAKTDPGGGMPSSLRSSLASKAVRENFSAVLRFTKEGNPVCPVY